ncbi:hypothetical protein QCA50_011405 [Cerrena zonata]|uniref:Protein kinase domain-containing protein n=1 Tax=Cerrena zonata TaxID=2478898 RepID=A0AAW0FVG6_9APHY
MQSTQTIEKSGNTKVGNALRKIFTRAKVLASSTVLLSDSLLFASTRHTRLVRTISRVAVGDIVAIDEIEHLEGDDAQRALDVIQEALDRPLELEATESNSLISGNERLCNTMIQLSNNSKKVPSSLFLELEIPDTRERPLRAGACNDVYCREHHGKRVALKRILPHIWSITQAEQCDFYVACLRWKRLSHPNIVPLYGMAKGSNSPIFVLPWFERGNIGDYLRRTDVEADVNQRITWISEIASGLACLHKNGIYHGGLRREKVLISDDGVAQLTDAMMTPFQRQRDGEPNIRWVAPELYEDAHITSFSDVFTFGLLCVTIFTDAVPFPDLAPNLAGMRIMKGSQPSQPATMPDEIWTLIQQCFDFDPQRRPSMSYIVTALHERKT